MWRGVVGNAQNPRFVVATQATHMDAARDAQLAAMDATALVAELRALSDAGSRYEEQAQCCAHLCETAARLAGAAAEAAVRAVVAALSRGAEHAPLVMGGCVALGVLVVAAPATSATAGADGVAAVLAAMRAHPGDARVQSATCYALSELVARDEINRRTAGAAGGVAAVVAAMARHPADSFVAQRACGALGNLTRRHRQNAADAVHAGAATIALGAMRDFSTDVDVQTAGCHAMCHILDAAGTLGGVHADSAAADAAVAAMRAFASDSALQRCCCDVLRCVFFNDRNADAAWVRRGAAVLTAVTVALRTHRHDVGMLTAGCAVIKLLMLNTKACKTAAGIAGTIQAVVAAMRAFPAAATLQVHGCESLCNTCYGMRDNQLAAAAAGGLEVTISAMRSHASNAEVQMAGCIALTAMIADLPPSQTRAGELGGVEAMMEALHACAAAPLAADRTEFSTRWCTTLSRLVQDQPMNTHKAVAAGAIELVVVHMCAPAAAPRVFQWGCGLLSCLVFDTGHEARAVLAGALEALEARRAEDADYEAARLDVIRHLQPARRRHDAAPCVVAGYMRCEAARARGLMCALPGCGARSRDGAANKKLLRCGTCRTACYCGAAHQREDWRRHKGECGATTRDDDEDEAGGAS